MRAAADRALGVTQQLEHAQDVALTVLVSAALDGLPQRFGKPLGLTTQDAHQERPPRLSRTAHELHQVGATLHQAPHEREHVLRAPLGYQVQQLGVELVVDEPQGVPHAGRGHRALSERQRLVQHR